jgi:hypothetical protein
LLAWQLLLVLSVSLAYESLFINAGLNHLDEAWPLYAAMRLHQGGVLYQDALWVFPPGHMWMAWIAYALDPPGVTAARIFYAYWNVALAGAMLLLGRRLMPSGFAVLGALLLAIAAPRTHLMHAVYGYRYLFLAVLALLCFDLRLRSGKHRWLVVAGALSGFALMLRLTPPFAVSCGVAVGAVAASRDWRSWVRDWSGFVLGLALALAPALIWYQSSIGLAKLWSEVVLHPLGMLQDLPWPELALPETWARTPIRMTWVAFEFRLYWVLYAGYVGVLGWRWVRDLREGRSSRDPLLVAVVVWGTVFFIRSLGRSDEPHLDSVIPPICLLLAHLTGLVFERFWPEQSPRPGRLRSRAGICIAVLVVWVFLNETDVAIGRSSLGRHPVLFRGETVWLSSPHRARMFNELFKSIEDHTSPGDVILDMGAAPIFYVATDRLGPGVSDVLMPGTFRDTEEEISFLRRLKARPPAAVVWPPYPFDEMKERSVQLTAPLISEWVKKHYEPVGPVRRWILLLPKWSSLGSQGSEL